MKQYSTPAPGFKLEIEWTGETTFVARVTRDGHDATWEAPCALAKLQPGGWDWASDPDASAFDDVELDAIVSGITSAVEVGSHVRGALRSLGRLV